MVGTNDKLVLTHGDDDQINVCVCLSVCLSVCMYVRTNMMVTTLTL